jgi:serine/threonine-protein kinase HipA
LGGARPKAAVFDKDGSLAIAKFPLEQDECPVEKWEAAALTLAEKAGIQVPAWRLVSVLGRSVLLERRFDRNEVGHRIPFLSSMSMLEANDGDKRSYLEIADGLNRYGANPDKDREDLWRRMVFNILTSNVDDHLRNHGCLYTGPDGWKLSPAYDLNPVPTDIRPRILSTAIDFDNADASLDLALSVSQGFGIDDKRAREIAAEVGAVVALWRDAAAKVGLTKAQTDRMSSAFEHKDLEQARKLSMGCAIGPLT